MVVSPCYEWHSPLSMAIEIKPWVLEIFPMLIYYEIKGLKVRKRTLECLVYLREFKDDKKLCLFPRCNYVFPLGLHWYLAHLPCNLFHLSCQPRRASYRWQPRPAIFSHLYWRYNESSIWNCCPAIGSCRHCHWSTMMTIEEDERMETTMELARIRN